MTQQITFPERQQSEATCPKCGPLHKLEVHTNHQTGQQFLGCPNYPDCHHTQAIPQEWYMRAMGQPELF
jgi:ssDNA-binding Zn-finger/Zn-ribbon topoisomerase 1